MSLVTFYKQKEETKLNKMLAKYGKKYVQGKIYDFDKLIEIKRNFNPASDKHITIYERLIDQETHIVAYGGPRGTGKSELGISANLQQMYLYKEKFNGVYLRNKSRDLEELKTRFVQALTADGLRRNVGYSLDNSKGILKLKNGSVLQFYHVEGDGLLTLQGSNLTHVTLEEPQLYKNIKQIVSSLEAMRGRTDNGVFSKMYLFFNPLGPSTTYLKENYVNFGDGVEIIKKSTREGSKSLGKKQIFFQARLSDNPFLSEEYIDSLYDLPEHMQQAWYHGNWDIRAGLAFPMLSISNNGFEDAMFKPDNYPWYISLDWGWHDKTAIGFYAMVNFNNIKRLIKFDEVVFTQKTPEEAGLIIKEVMKKYNQSNFMFGVADTSINAETQGESTAIRMQKSAGLYFRPAHKSRETGYMRLYELIKQQRIFFYTNLNNFWSTVPDLITSEVKGDIEENPKQDDHVYDETRYMVMALNFD